MERTDLFPVGKPAVGDGDVSSGVEEAGLHRGNLRGA